jgi:hypothetical protein
MFFFEKKNQKTFGLSELIRSKRRAQKVKSFLFLFFKKEKLSSSCL